MEIEKIATICRNNECIFCPFYVEELSECIFECIPESWDSEEIERILKNYGEKEN